MRKRSLLLIAALALAMSFTGSAWGALSVTGNSSGYTHTGGVLTITAPGEYTINGGGSETSDRIVVRSGVKAIITLENVIIKRPKLDGDIPSVTVSGGQERLPGYKTGDSGVGDQSQGRPFSMKGAEVTLIVKGTNSFTATAYSTALFCPKDSILTIEGDGTLDVIAGDQVSVSAIGGEGTWDKQYKQFYEANTSYGSAAGYNYQRSWKNAGDDGICGKITIKGSVKLNAKVNGGIKMMKSFDGNYSPVIGGAGGGPVEIIGDAKVDVYGEMLTVGIGSVTKDFNGIHIGERANVVSKVAQGSGKVDGTDPAAPEITFINHAMTDLTGGDMTYGPAIGWAEYSPLGDSSVSITIDGNAVVTAVGGYGGAGIGGGRNGSGGFITIGGEARVVATGGWKASGIGNGISHNDGEGVMTGQIGSIIIKDKADVTATGGIDAAGIGAGAYRCASVEWNLDGTVKRAVKISNGNVNAIIISGSPTITATGGKNSAAIGGGGNDGSYGLSGTPQPTVGCGYVEGIMITGTPTLILNKGEAYDGMGKNVGSTSAIGPGQNRGTQNDLTFIDPDTYQTQRFDQYISTVKESTFKDSKGGAIKSVPATNSLVVNVDGDLVLKGTVDITTARYPKEVAEALSAAIVSYLNANSGKKIKSADGSAVKLTIASGYTIQSSQIEGSNITVANQSPKGASIPGMIDAGEIPPYTPPADDGNDSGSQPVLPDLPEDQKKYDPTDPTITPAELIEELEKNIAASSTASALDRGGSTGGSGVNFVITGGDGELKMISSDKGSSGSANFKAGQLIWQEIYVVVPDGPNGMKLNESHAIESKSVNVEVIYSGTVLLTYTGTVTNGHLAVKIPTNDVIVKLHEHISSSARTAAEEENPYDLILRIYDDGRTIDSTMPIRISFATQGGDDAQDGQKDNGRSSGGGSCSAGAAIMISIAAWCAMRKNKR